MQTIQVKFRRHIEHKSHYMFETLRPAHIYNALIFLCAQVLYIQNNISMDSSFAVVNKFKNDENVNFIVHPNDNISNIEFVNQIVQDEENINMSASDLLNSIDGDDEVMLLNLNTNIAQDSIITMAPGQGKKPLPWLIHPHVDELCFPKMFAGQPFNINEVSYVNRIKSELRRWDRRSCIPTRVLYAGKKKQEQEVISSMYTCLRKVKGRLLYLLFFAFIICICLFIRF